MKKPTFFEGILTGFLVFEAWLIWHYGWGFELQGLGHGFRPFTLFNLCLFAFIMYRYLTNFNVIETTIYTIIQYIFFDSIFALAIIPTLDQLESWPMWMHYIIIYICLIILVIYYKSKYKPKSSFNRNIFPLLLGVGILIFLFTKLGWTVPNNNAAIMASQGDADAFLLYNKDQFFKWLMFIPFMLSSKKVLHK